MPSERTTVRFETRRVTVVRPAAEPIDLWCAVCATTVAMATPEFAARILKTKPRDIYRRVEKGELHFVETDGGELLICCESLDGATKVQVLKSAAANPRNEIDLQ